MTIAHWGLKVKDYLVVLLHWCLHRPISMYSQRISARTFWKLFLLSLISLDVAFNILHIHENGQKTKTYYVESIWLFSDVLLLKWRFWLYECHHPWFVHCSELEFGASRLLLEQSSSSLKAKVTCKTEHFSSPNIWNRHESWADPGGGRSGRPPSPFSADLAAART